MKTTLIVATLAVAFASAACDRHESAADHRADVATAQNEASKDVAEARDDAGAKIAAASKTQASGEADAGHEVAKADENVALAEAKGAHKVALAKCDALKGDSLSTCRRQADADFEVAKAHAHQDRAATDPKS